MLFIGWLILTPYPRYLPPDFTHGFLANKFQYFYSSGYFLGFYAHIASAPLALLCGTIQMSRTVRIHRPGMHRMLGRIYVALVLCLMAPGGLIMATRAFGGASSILCFALISILAWWFTLAGWRAALQRDYAAHGRWMARSYVMICSAIMLRLIHYFLQPLELDRTLTYQLAAWLSWVPTLVALEMSFRQLPKTRRMAATATVLAEDASRTSDEASSTG